MQPVRTIFFLPRLWNNGSVHGYILYSTKMSELSQFFFSSLFSLVLISGLLSIEGEKIPTLGVSF